MVLSERLLAVWEIIRWFDHVRWNEEEMKRTFIPGPVYESLEDSEKILAHWLAYITDQQRPYEDVWMKGAPILSEIVKAYKGEGRPGFEVLKRFSRSSDKKGGVDTFLSKWQTVNGEPMEYTSRFGMHIVSIAATLHLLEQFNRNIVEYLSRNWDFIEAAKQQGNGDNRTSRIAFLLYLLTYDSAKQGMVSFERNEKGIRNHVESHSKRIKKVLGDNDELVERFHRWSGKERFHKRLWASLRDYLKPGSPYNTHLIKAVKQLENERFMVFLKGQNEILECLELPGDIWNLRFIDKIFSGEVTTPAELRERYQKLIHTSGSEVKFYPEQFDVSFSFSPYMCDEAMEDYCPFRVDSDIMKFCQQRTGTGGKKNLCPVAMVTCGYRYYCNPEGCPIRVGIKKHLCPGCSVRIDGT